MYTLFDTPYKVFCSQSIIRSIIFLHNWTLPVPLKTWSFILHYSLCPQTFLVISCLPAYLALWSLIHYNALRISEDIHRTAPSRIMAPRILKEQTRKTGLEIFTQIVPFSLSCFYECLLSYLINLRLSTQAQEYRYLLFAWDSWVFVFFYLQLVDNTRHNNALDFILAQHKAL